MKRLILIASLYFSISNASAQIAFTDQIIEVINNQMRIIKSVAFTFGVVPGCAHFELFTYEVLDGGIVDIRFYYNTGFIGIDSRPCSRTDTVWIDLPLRGIGGPFPAGIYTIIVHAVEVWYDWIKGYQIISHVVDTIDDVALSVNNYTAKTNVIEVFPNPSRDIFNMEYPRGLDIFNISLIDLQGRKIKLFKGSQKQLNISGTLPGQYFLNLETSKGIITEKVLIE